MFIKDIERVRGGRKLDTAQTMAKGLGIFGLATGVFQAAAAGPIARWLGLRSHKPLLRGNGARELAAGVGILAMRDPTLFIWSRAAGGVADLATLGVGLRASRRKSNVLIAMGSIAAITALDLVCALQLTQNIRQPKTPVRDYSTRSGFPMGLQHAFGVARRELKQGQNWWDLWRENQGRGSDQKIELKGDGGQRAPAFERRGEAEYGAPAGNA